MANSLAAHTRDFTLTYAVEPVFNNLIIFWKLPLCQEPSHGMKVPFCICKSPGFYLYGICAWILMLFEPCDVCTSVSHVFFHPPWKPHSSSSAAMKTPARIPLLSSPLTHLSTALQAATTHFSAVTARELKLWVCCHPQRAPRTYKRYRFFKQVSTSTNLTFNYSSLRDDTFVGKTCPSLPTPRWQRGKDSGTWRLGEATEKQWKSEEKRTLSLQDAHRIGCAFNTSFRLLPLFSCLLYRGGDCSHLSVKRFPLQLNKDPQPRRSSLFPSSSFPSKKREQNSAARGTL